MSPSEAQLDFYLKRDFEHEVSRKRDPVGKEMARSNVDA